jgi:hypothetical protein
MFFTIIKNSAIGGIPEKYLAAISSVTLGAPYVGIVFYNVSADWEVYPIGAKYHSADPVMFSII